MDTNAPLVYAEQAMTPFAKMPKGKLELVRLRETDITDIPQCKVMMV